MDQDLVTENVRLAQVVRLQRDHIARLEKFVERFAKSKDYPVLSMEAAAILELGSKESDPTGDGDPGFLKALRSVVFGRG